MKIAQFLQEVRSEVKKVDWPSREETIHYTVMVVVVSLLVAVLLGSFDFLFQYLVSLI